MDNIEQFKKHIAFDLDGTILTEVEWPNFGKPIPENVAFIKQLYDAGVPIAIYTARIYQDKSMEEKTIAELKRLDIPYNELSCEKKSYYVLFVDDKAESVVHNKPWSEDNKNKILEVVEKYKMNEKPVEAKIMSSDMDLVNIVYEAIKKQQIPKVDWKNFWKEFYRKTP